MNRLLLVGKDSAAQKPRRKQELVASPFTQSAEKSH